MTLKSRAFLIFGGILVFAILGPAAILLARGYSFDLATGRIVRTGVLVVKTEPRGAKVSLNGTALKPLTPLTKRFLRPGEYRVEIQKDGFRPWQKRVVVSEERVTALPAGELGKISLFLSSEAPQIVATTTLDVLDQSLFAEPESSQNPEYLLDPQSGKLLRKNPGSKQPDAVLEGLPKFSKSQIIATPANELFLLLDDDLYHVMETLEKISSEVAYARTNPDLPGLIYGNSHEVWLYLSEEQTSELVTRSSLSLGRAQFNNKTGYVFVAEEKQIKAIEFDRSGQPNIYVLAETQNPLPKFAVNAEGTELLYLDGQSLYRLKIR